jgi:hypothetical protein
VVSDGDPCISDCDATAACNLGGSCSLRPDFGDILSLNELPVGSLFACTSCAGGVTGRAFLAMLPANSTAGLFLPDVNRSSHGNPDIESLFPLVYVVVYEGDSSAMVFADLGLGEFQNIPEVGVVAPNATADVTAGGEEVPALKSGKCGHEKEDDSFGKHERALFRPANNDDDGANEEDCLLDEGTVPAFESGLGGIRGRGKAAVSLSWPNTSTVTVLNCGLWSLSPIQKRSLHKL